MAKLVFELERTYFLLMSSSAKLACKKKEEKVRSKGHSKKMVRTSSFYQAHMSNIDSFC